MPLYLRPQNGQNGYNAFMTAEKAIGLVKRRRIQAIININRIFQPEEPLDAAAEQLVESLDDTRTVLAQSYLFPWMIGRGSVRRFRQGLLLLVTAIVFLPFFAWWLPGLLWPFGIGYAILLIVTGMIVMVSTSSAWYKECLSLSECLKHHVTERVVLTHLRRKRMRRLWPSVISANEQLAQKLQTATERHEAALERVKRFLAH